MAAYDRTQAAARMRADAEFAHRLHRATAPGELGYEAAWLTQPGQLSQAAPDEHVPAWPWSKHGLMRAMAAVMLLATLVFACAGCGGGSVEDDDGDATLQPFPPAASAPVMTIQPVRCYGAAAAAAECQQ